MRLAFPFLCGVAALSAACSEPPLISGGLEEELNGPVSMAFVPGTNLALVANANINLTRVSGSLVALDLDTRTLLFDTMIGIPNFSGRMWVDGGAERLYLADRNDDALLAYDYSVSGQDISFTEVEAPEPVKAEVPNGIETDEDPFDVFLQTGTSQGDVLYVTNAMSGSVSVVPTESLLPPDLDPDHGDFLGFPLLSAADFPDEDSRPGRGAQRFVPWRAGRLLFVTSTASNRIYVIDTMDQKVEAMLDLSGISNAAGTRGMVITDDGLAYIAHRGLGGIVVLDVNGVTENGVDMEVLDAVFVDFIPTGRGPEGVALSSDLERLFVTNQEDGTVSVVDRAFRRVLAQVETGGSYPGEILPDPGRGVLYVLNSSSDTISVLSEADGSLMETIPE